MLAIGYVASPAHAAADAGPSNPFTGVSTSFDEPPTQAKNYNLGIAKLERSALDTSAGSGSNSGHNDHRSQHEQEEDDHPNHPARANADRMTDQWTRKGQIR
jgi:hypothetical protein